MSILALLTGIFKALGIALGLVERHQIEGAGRAKERAETTEKANAVQNEMLDAAADRPRDPDELAKLMRDGKF